MCFTFHDDKPQAEIDVLTLKTLQESLSNLSKETFFLGILALPNLVMPAKTNGLSDKRK